MLSLEDLKRRLAMWQDVESRVRTFFVERGFQEVRTPILVTFPGMEPNLDPIETNLVTSPHPSVQRKGSTAALVTSPEYSMKKLLGSGLEKIFTITPVFRNNESGLHNKSEFIMLEWYAPGEYQDLLDETEALFQFVLENDTSWPRFSYEEAHVDEHGDPHIDQERVFITNYPVEQASLAKISVDGSYAERFEAFADGLELCNGFAELTDVAEQRKRFQAEQKKRRLLGKTVFPIDEELLEALDYIKKPVYGNALGLDRLVMIKYGVGDINDIQLF